MTPPEKIEPCRDDWNRWESLALLTWGLVEAVICVKAGLFPRPHSVYPIFALAGQHWLQGVQIYGGVSSDLDVFRYSPLSAALFAPFSLLPDGPAGVLWRLLNFGVFVAGMCWWLQAVLPNQVTRTQRALIFLLLLPLSLSSLSNGQVNPLLIGLLLVAAAAVRSGRFNLAGGAVALACWLKVYPIAFGLLLVLLYRGRFLKPFLAALLAGFALPFLLQRPEYVWSQYVQWLAYLKADDRQGLDLYVWLKDVRLLFKLCAVPLSAAAFTALQLASSLAVAFCCWYRQRRGDAEPRLLLALTFVSCAWMMVFGPSVEAATWIVLAPALVTPLVLAWSAPGFPVQRSVLLASYALFLAGFMVKWLPWRLGDASPGRQPLAALIYFGMQPLAALICFACIFISALRNRLPGGDDHVLGPVTNDQSSGGSAGNRAAA